MAHKLTAEFINDYNHNQYIFERNEKSLIVLSFLIEKIIFFHKFPKKLQT